MELDRSNCSLWNLAHPFCQPPAGSVFSRPQNFTGFQNLSASFTDKEAGGVRARMDDSKLHWKKLFFTWKMAPEDFSPWTSLFCFILEWHAFLKTQHTALRLATGRWHAANVAQWKIESVCLVVTDSSSYHQHVFPPLSNCFGLFTKWIRAIWCIALVFSITILTVAPFLFKYKLSWNRNVGHWVCMTVASLRTYGMKSY